MDELGSTRFQLLRKLGAGGMGVVYEAYDRQTDAVVAIKALKRFDGDALFRFKHEFRALADIQHPNLLRFGELYCEREQWFFTMELIHGKDFFQYVRLDNVEREQFQDTELDEQPTMQVSATTGGAPEPLPHREHKGKPRGFDETRLRAAARQLAVAIHALHRSGRVHRDIKPSNVLVRPDGHLVLLDFGLIGEIGGRRDEAREGFVLGTPYFMAPEQVMSQEVGPAADWYSFGVLLFLSLTGSLPFVGAPNVVVDAKCTEPAPAPNHFCHDVPTDLDELCCDLLARSPSDRPSGDAILRRLGADDSSASAVSASSGYETSSGLFVGRTEELSELAEAFARCKAGSSEFVLVQGEPGVGKSTLVRGFLEREVALDPQAVVLAGRCYEQESVPFKAFDTVIDSLSLQLAALPAEKIDEYLRSGVRFLASIFPVLKRVPAVAERVPDDRVVATALALRDQAFSELKHLLGAMSREMPLVLFIDDLQWADKDSLALLEALFTPPDAPRALLVCTQRTTTASGQPLGTLGGLIKLPFRYIDLHGLSRDESRALCNALWRSSGAPAADEAAMGALLDEATGHPLFLSELVRYARSDHKGRERSTRLQDVLWLRIEALDEPARHFMELVALAGVPIQYQAVAQAAELNASDGVHLMGALRQAQLIRVTRRGDRRLVEPYHDRIREAIVQHLHAGERPGASRQQRLHLRLGRRLLEHTSDEDLPAEVFSIVNHLNAAAPLIDTRAERRRTAELNLLAGRQAKLSTAYAAGLEYQRRGLVLLDEDPWQSDYELCKSLHWEQIETEYLAGDRDLALRHFAELLPRLTTDEERSDLYVLKIILETGHGRSAEAIAAGREALDALGVHLPRNSSTAAVLREYALVRWTQRGRKIERFIDLPELTDVRKRCASKLLMWMTPAAFFVSSKLLAIINIRMVRIAMRYGVGDLSAYAFAGYGLVLAGSFRRFEDAYSFGQLSLRMLERFPNPRLKCKIYFQNGTYLTPWLRPFAEGIAQNRIAVEAGVKHGDMVYEAYAAATTSVIAYNQAEHLETMQSVAESSHAITSRRKSKDMTAMMMVHTRYCQALRGLGPDRTALAGAESTNEQFGETLGVKQTPVALFYYYFLNAQLAYWYDDLARARAMLAKAEQLIAAIFSIPTTNELHLWQLLIAARRYPEASLAEQIELEGKMRRSLKFLARTAPLCPQNYAAQYKLAVAEHTRLFRRRQALDRFSEAVKTAREYQNGKWEALGLELAARQLREHGAAEAQEHLQQAIDAYVRWGADAKAAHLRSLSHAS
jgi:predicted ATPase/serine/threonine protein kinase